MKPTEVLLCQLPSYHVTVFSNKAALLYTDMAINLVCTSSNGEIIYMFAIKRHSMHQILRVTIKYTEICIIEGITGLKYIALLP